MTTTTTAIPENMLVDAKGRWVPKSLIKPLDLMRHELVVERAKKAAAVHDILTSFKRESLETVRAFLDLSAQEFGTRIEGEKGNVTLTSYDGQYRVQLAVSDRVGFNERLQVAKKLVDECIAEWAEGSRVEIRVLVNDAFQVDKKGAINTERVLRLRQLEIDHPVWKRAMQAIGESIVTESTCTYIRFYERVQDDKYRAIELDLSRV